MNPHLPVGLAISGSYLLGSMPTGYLLTRWVAGVDVRSQGSGNVGATNVARVAGATSGLIVLCLDTLKGILAVTLLPWLIARYAGTALPPTASLWCGVAAVVGHDWTCWLKFSGGKGIATSLGVLLGIAPVVALGCVAIWALVFAISRIVSLSSIITALVAPFLLWFVHPARAWVAFGIVLAIIAVFRHNSNIHKLLHRTEQKFRVS